MLTAGPTQAEGEAVGKHFEYWGGLVQNGTALVVGRTQTTGPETIGLAIYRTPDEESAREVADADPAVAAGVFTMRLYPYHVALLGDPEPFRP